MTRTKSKRTFSDEDLALLHELIDCNPETGVFTNKVGRQGAKAGSIAGHKNGTGYLEINWDRRRCQAHRLVWFLAHGTWPPEHIDHINGDKTDNRIANLRLSTNAENMQNQRRQCRGGKAGLLGVSWCSARRNWHAQILAGGKRHRLGAFDTPEQAHTAYLAAKARLHPFQTLV